MARLVLGIDGGGTKTACVAVTDAGELVGEGVGGSANTNFVSGDFAAASLVHAAESALRGHPGMAERVSAVVVGAPMDPMIVRAVVEKAWPGASLHLLPEGEIVLASARVPYPAVAIIAGTGSLAYGKESPAGPAVTVGGWGSIMGDEGSGYEIGREALQAVARAADGRGPSTLLTERVLQWAACPTVRDVPRVVHRLEPERTRPRIAALCRDVQEAATAGDAVASALLARAGQALAVQVLAAARNLGVPASSPLSIVCGGGVLRMAAAVREALAAATADVFPAARVMVPTVSAAHGAAVVGLRREGWWTPALASRLLGADVPQLVAARESSGPGPNPRAEGGGRAPAGKA